MAKREKQKKLRKGVYAALLIMILIPIVIVSQVSANRGELNGQVDQKANSTSSNTNNDVKGQKDIDTLDTKATVADSNANNHTIILDPGHGGTDPGSIGADGTLEKNLNLSIAKKLQKSYTQSGYTVIMTREDDRLLCDSGLKTPFEREKSDLNNRIKIMAQNPKTIFISIHQNFNDNKNYSGTQVYYSLNYSGSKKFAQLVQNDIKENLQPDNTGETHSPEKLRVLVKATTPAVMIECGFISNKNEVHNLENDDYQNELVLAIKKATDTFFSNA